MQRALSFEATPGAFVPLRFMLAAPWFAAGAGLLLAWAGPLALAGRWSPPLLALTHLITLGFLGTTMVGAILQMLPVVADTPVPGTRPVGLAAWIALACGTVLLAAALLKGSALLFVAAALVLGPGLLAFIGAVLFALASRVPQGALPMVGGMRFALPAFAATALLGLSLALYFAGGPALPAIQVANLHAMSGLIGWVAMLVIAVSFQVVPMFQATPVYPAWMCRSLPAALAALLCGWAAAHWRGSAWEPWAAGGIALLLASYAGFTLRLLSKSRSKQADITQRYWQLSLASLTACAVLYAVPVIHGDKRTVLLGMVFLAGFAMSVVNGMLYKIVPFLLWYHLGAAGMPRAAVPKVTQWIGARAAKWQWVSHAATVAALILAVLMPALARAGGVLLAVDAAWLGTLLAGAALRYRRILRSSALERA